MKHEIVRVKAGDYLYKEGEECRTMYLIKQGRLRLENNIGGQHIEGMSVFSGSVVGELSFFDGLPRESSVKAMMNCVLISITFDSMKKKLEAIPPWFQTILNSIVGRVRATEMNVLKASNKGATMDYTKKDMKSEGYTYIDKKDLVKIIAVLSMVTAKFSKKGVHSYEVSYDALKKFIIRFQLGSGKMTEVLNVLQEHELVKVEDIGEGKTKLEVKELDHIDSLLKNLVHQQDKSDLGEDEVRVLNALDSYFKDTPILEDGTKEVNVVDVQDQVLSNERYFLREMAFKLLEDNGYIKRKVKEGDDEFSDFSFEPGLIEAFLPAQKLISSIGNINKEH